MTLALGLAGLAEMIRVTGDSTHRGFDHHVGPAATRHDLAEIGFCPGLSSSVGTVGTPARSRSMR